MIIYVFIVYHPIEDYKLSNDFTPIFTKGYKKIQFSARTLVESKIKIKFF